MRDHYRTLAARAEHRIKVERSEFLGIAFPIAAEDAFFAELQAIEKKYFDATHHCWAFRLFDGERARSSDAGEPAGTAGKPILSAFGELFDAGVVVVRWFGGVKLGTGGLSRAYREAAAAVLEVAPIAERYVYERVRVVVPFEAMGTAYRLVKAPDVVLAGERFGEVNEFEFDVRRSMVEQFRRTLREKRLTLP
ncbi:MAG TPA: YigZ family protein [Thermoanaerobaculia bacterium]|nr:YigZ family protein [Thermoanaerobaculia bacterium]